MSKKQSRKDEISSPMVCGPQTWAWMAAQMKQAMEAQAGTSSIQNTQPKSAKKNDEPSESEETSSDDDFLPEKKSRCTEEPRKRGRPSKVQVEQRRKSSAQSSTSTVMSAAATVNAQKVVKYPKPFDESLLKIAYAQEGECPACQTYVGSVIVKPCGHAKYCMKCINKLRAQACKNRRPAMCLDRECYKYVTSWFVMNNIHLQPDPEPQQ